MGNPTKERRGQICLACNKKFLYRDAMHEYAIKLELREGATQTQQEDLEHNEERYNRLMSDLTELKEIKEQKSKELAKSKADTNFKMEEVQADIEKLRREKEHLVAK